MAAVERDMPPLVKRLRKQTSRHASMQVNSVPRRSFDDFVGDCEQRGRDSDAEHSGGLAFHGGLGPRLGSGSLERLNDRLYLGPMLRPAPLHQVEVARVFPFA